MIYYVHRTSRERNAPLEWHFFSHGNHGFAGPDSAGYQPELAQRVWPLVTDFLQRVLCEPAQA